MSENNPPPTCDEATGEQITISRAAFDGLCLRVLELEQENRSRSKISTLGIATLIMSASAFAIASVVSRDLGGEVMYQKMQINRLRSHIGILSDQAWNDETVNEFKSFIFVGEDGKLPDEFDCGEGTCTVSVAELDRLKQRGYHLITVDMSERD